MGWCKQALEAKLYCKIKFLFSNGLHAKNLIWSKTSQVLQPSFSLQGSLLSGTELLKVYLVTRYISLLPKKHLRLVFCIAFQHLDVRAVS